MVTDPATTDTAAWSLQTELARIQDVVRREPAKAAHRSALLQLQCIAGAWDKAARQLAVLSDLDPEAQLFCTQGKLLLACEAERTRCLAVAPPVLPG